MTRVSILYVINIPTILAKEANSLKQETDSGTLYIYYYYIVTKILLCSSVVFYVQNMLAAFQI